MRPSLLQRLIRSDVRLGARLVPIYLLFGMFACWTGGVVTLVATVGSGYSLAVGCAVVLGSIGGMLGWVALRRRLSGHESFIAIENLLAAFLPVLAIDQALDASGALLDVQALGLGTFMVIGRIGCFANGCCYGAPSDVGVCYTHGRHDSQVRRFPAQLVSSGGWAVLVAVGSLVWFTQPTGSTLSFMLIGYGPLRLLNEFLRGDVRPRIGGWTTGALGAVLLWILGLLIAPGGALWAAFGASAVVIVAVFTSSRWLALPTLYLPAPAALEARDQTPVIQEWAGYRLAVSKNGQQLWVSVSAPGRLLGPAEADAVLTHHHLRECHYVAPGVYAGSIPLPQAAPVDYLRRLE